MWHACVGLWMRDLGVVLLERGSNCCDAGLKKTKRISVRYHLFTMSCNGNKAKAGPMKNMYKMICFS